MVVGASATSRTNRRRIFLMARDYAATLPECNTTTEAARSRAARMSPVECASMAACYCHWRFFFFLTDRMIPCDMPSHPLAGLLACCRNLNWKSSLGAVERWKKKGGGNGIHQRGGTGDCPKKSDDGMSSLFPTGRGCERGVRHFLLVTRR